MRAVLNGFWRGIRTQTCHLWSSSFSPNVGSDSAPPLITLSREKKIDSNAGWLGRKRDNTKHNKGCGKSPSPLFFLKKIFQQWLCSFSLEIIVHGFRVFYFRFFWGGEVYWVPKYNQFHRRRRRENKRFFASFFYKRGGIEMSVVSFGTFRRLFGGGTSSSQKYGKDEYSKGGEKDKITQKPQSWFLGWWPAEMKSWVRDTTTISHKKKLNSTDYFLVSN